MKKEIDEKLLKDLTGALLEGRMNDAFLLFDPPDGISINPQELEGAQRIFTGREGVPQFKPDRIRGLRNAADANDPVTLPSEVRIKKIP